MKYAKVLMIILIIGLAFLAGCSKGYSSYNNAPAAPTGAVIGGGCGVAGTPLDMDRLSDFGEINMASGV